MGTVDDRVAIVTGAARGVGRGIALALAKEGARVAVADVAPTEGVLADLAAAGGEAWAATCDVRVSAEVDAFVTAVVARWGGVDVLVNNAIATAVGPLHEMSDDDLALGFATGPLASAYFMRACFTHLRDSPAGGRVVNLRSGTEQNGLPGYTAYVAAKAAVGGLTRAAAREWGRHGITVNAVVPFSVDESMRSAMDEEQVAAMLRHLTIRRSGDPEADIGRAVVYLVGPDASYVTGATLMLDGGGAFFS